MEYINVEIPYLYGGHKETKKYILTQDETTKLEKRGIEIKDGTLIWNYDYVMADNDKDFSDGHDQELVLKQLGIF